MASVAAPSIRDRVAEALDSDRRLAFLAELAWHLVIANRFYYPAHDTDAYRQLGDLICLNEVHHVLTSQLRSDFGDRRGGFPDQALIERLTSSSSAWNCETAYSDAIHEAVASVRDGAPSRETESRSDLIDSAESALGSARRAVFLSALFLRLAEASRSVGPHGASDLATYAEPMRCCNELLHHLAIQMCSDLSSDQAVPEGPALAEILVNIANSGHCGAGLRDSFERALARIDPHT